MKKYSELYMKGYREGKTTFGNIKKTKTIGGIIYGYTARGEEIPITPIEFYRKKRRSKGYWAGWMKALKEKIEETKPPVKEVMKPPVKKPFWKIAIEKLLELENEPVKKKTPAKKQKPVWEMGFEDFFPLGEPTKKKKRASKKQKSIWEMDIEDFLNP